MRVSGAKLRANLAPWQVRRVFRTCEQGLSSISIAASEGAVLAPNVSIPRFTARLKGANRRLALMPADLLRRT